MKVESMEFATLVKYFEQVEQTTKRLEMFDILASLYDQAEVGEIDKIIYLSQGELLPAFHGLVMGMSEKLLTRSLAQATDTDPEKVSEAIRQSGDPGLTAAQLISADSHHPGVVTVYEQLLSIARETGEKSIEKKVQMLSDLLAGVSAVEAKYLARFVMGRLRLGIGDATVLEALCLSRLKDRGQRPRLERAYNLCGDLGLVARTLFLKGPEGIDAIGVQVGYPIRMALCERLSSPEEIIKKIGRCAVEAKYDGLRLQVHKRDQKIILFTRNLENMTGSFPDIVEGSRRQLSARDVILEGEAVAYDPSTGDLHPFQTTIQRKRKHGVDRIAKELPLKFFVFDLLFADGTDFTCRPYSERRERLEALIRPGDVMIPSECIQTEDPTALGAFFDSAAGRGLEGIIAKRLDAHYTAGSRNFNWIKLKRSYRTALTDSLDLCIVGYFRGKGQRAKFGIGTVLAAVYDPDSDQFKTISKVGSGFSEAELSQLRALLDPIARLDPPADVDSLIQPDVWVDPRYIVTVTADEITRSPGHTCGRQGEQPGYALRFPRVQGFIRADKKSTDANTVAEVIEMFKRQRRGNLQE